ncbi:MAG TPA: PilZ domain-containing protein [Bryobacteraceae bacterium]|nr:PilZ domain-containing protein [Bryobacteraceae bacterium]
MIWQENLYKVVSLEQRRTQRYRLQLPLQIVQLGNERVNRIEQTRDISSGGVCFFSPTDVEVGGRIEYLITLSGSNPPVRIRCLGKVLRSMPSRPETPHYEVAVTMDRYQFVRPEELQSVGVAV